MKYSKRIQYLIAFIILFIIEVIIALFVHDKIIRPYIGDIIVVVLLYCLVRIFITEKIRLLPLYILIFAVMVEILQYLNFVSLIGLDDIKFFRVIMGTSFSMIDIFCYIIGCTITAIYELIIFQKVKNGEINGNRKNG